MIRRSMLLAAFAIVAIAPAQAEFYTHYTVVMSGTQAVDGIVKWERDALGGGSVSWPDFLDGSSIGHIDQVFGSTLPRTDALFLGMSYDPDPNSDHTVREFLTAADLAAIPDANKHVVMFVSNGAAAALLGQSFEAMFPGFTESDVINWLEIVGQIGSPPTDEATFNDDLDHLSNLVNYADTQYNAYFSIPPDQNAVSGQFSVVRFSDGELVGTGETQQEFVPEPGTLSSLALGGLGLAAFRRRFRR